MIHLIKCRILIITFMLVFFITGCASTPEKTDDEKQITNEIDEILLVLAKKAVEAKQMTLEHQSAMLQLTQDGDKIDKITQDRLKIAIGMDKPIEFPDYQGEASSPLNMIAQLTNYKIEFVGIKPIDPIWVKLRQGSRSAMSWLNDIAIQTDAQGLDIDVWQDPQAILSDGSTNGLVPNGLIVITYRSEIAK